MGQDFWIAKHEQVCRCGHEPLYIAVPWAIRPFTRDQLDGLRLVAQWSYGIGPFDDSPFAPLVRRIPFGERIVETREMNTSPELGTLSFIWPSGYLLAGLDL